MISREDILERYLDADEQIPLLTIDEFFADNPHEDSIAPNQRGYGRPDLVEIAERLTRFEADADVAWVRVQLHEEMFDDDYEGVAAESIAICTSLDEDEVEERLDTDSLESDGVWEGMSYDEDDFSDIPAVPEDHRILTMSWD
ncbi:hypothetical protein [Gordonia humi]|uniref:Uncharacterized protein n=1 Tax=Gordonia humi TaxID=686429 RepID=A0A840F305_9ACTN|nr:hypothetical protein [Gordonia humi]MBB4135789.1 hypothetical protein [Gordonia humi]